MENTHAYVAEDKQEAAGEGFGGPNTRSGGEKVYDADEVSALARGQDGVIGRHVFKHLVAVEHDGVVAYDLMPEHYEQSDPGASFVEVVGESIFNRTLRGTLLACT